MADTDTARGPLMPMPTTAMASSPAQPQTGFTSVQIRLQLGHSSNYNLTRSMLEFQVQHLMSQPNCMIKVRLLSCHNQNGRQPQPKWKTTSTKMEDNLTKNERRSKWKTTKMEETKMEDDQNGRRSKWKTTKMEDDQNGRRPKWKTTEMEDDRNGRRPKWKTTKMEDDQNGRRPKWKTTKMKDDRKRRRPKTKTTKRRRPPM